MVLLQTTEKKIRILLALAVFLNIAVWFYARDFQARWTNVPPAPEKRWAAAAAGWGDYQLSYRVIALMLQNMGDGGGRVVSLNDYNYEELARWFFVEDYLDRHSDYVPYLASYYFGGLTNVEKIKPVISYLEYVGSRKEGQKWRWLAQAVFLTRFKLNDMEKALALAQKLSAIDNPSMPEWSRQMPAFVMTAMGEKEAAYAMMLEMLKTQGNKMHPNEVTNMKYYICQRILKHDDASKNPLCEGIDLNVKQE